MTLGLCILWSDTCTLPTYIFWEHDLYYNEIGGWTSGFRTE